MKKKKQKQDRSKRNYDNKILKPYETKKQKTKIT